MRRRLRRDIRFLKMYAFCSTSLVVFLAATGFRQASPQRTRFDEIDVERVNIVERDGRVRLVIANSERQAQAVIDGKTITSGRRPAGMIFFNDIGDEVGGLIFSGRQVDGTPRASGSLTFDQFRQDQTVALQYVEENGRRRAGLEIIDRPQTSLAVLADLYARRASANGPEELADVNRQIAALPPQTTRRVFAGKDFDGNATLVLSDGQGRPRLRLNVDPAGTHRIQFLDASGKAVREIG